LINSAIDRIDAAFTRSARWLPPDTPIGKLRIGSHRITWLDLFVAACGIVLSLGYGWYYHDWGHVLIGAGVFVLGMMIFEFFF